MPTRLTLVVSSRNGGKTTTLEHLIQEARSTAHQVGGVLALAKGEKNWYRLLDLSSNRSMLALWEDDNPDFGRFRIDQEAFDWANEVIEQALQTADIIVFDEIGRLELQGGGLAPSFRKALICPNTSILAAVRDANLDAVIDVFGLDRLEPTVLTLGKEMKTNE